jgi:hypothetical protein
MQILRLRPRAEVPTTVPLSGLGLPTTSDFIASAIRSTFPGSSVTVETSTGEVGGHWNFAFQMQFSSQDAANALRSKNISASDGFSRPARIGPRYAWHLENIGVWWNTTGGTYTIGATAHIDLFNPDTGVGGFFGHVFVDGVWGHIVQFFGENIDPNPCPYD